MAARQEFTPRPTHGSTCSAVRRTRPACREHLSDQPAVVALANASDRQRIASYRSHQDNEPDRTRPTAGASGVVGAEGGRFPLFLDPFLTLGAL